MKYSQTSSSSQATAPRVKISSITSDISQAFSNSRSRLITSLQSIRAPSLVSFTSAIPSSAPQQMELTEADYNGWTLLPTTPPQPTVAIPTENTSPLLPTYELLPTIKPTKPPTPTSKPTPTAVPTPVAPAEDLRPGKSLEDIFKIAGQTACVPSALLKAFVAQEGPGTLTYSDKSALFYNAYDWWHRVTEKQQVCSGYGYYPETGLIAEDSLYAGERCKEAFSPETANDTVSKSLGATQILQYYWEKTFKEKTKQALKVNNVDRRVLLDALVGFGIILKEGTKYNGSCDNWDFKYVIKAACVNTGGHCDYYNYCYTICKNYNKFASQNNSCDNVVNMFVPGSYCEFK